jgi:hypothetical protein
MIAIKSWHYAPRQVSLDRLKRTPVDDAGSSTVLKLFGWNYLRGNTRR